MTEDSANQIMSANDFLAGFQQQGNALFQDWYEDPSKYEAAKEAAGMGVVESVGQFLGDTGASLASSLGDALLFTARGTYSVGDEYVQAIARMFADYQGVDVDPKVMKSVMEMLRRDGSVVTPGDAVAKAANLLAGFGGFGDVKFDVPLEQLGREKALSRQMRPQTPAGQFDAWLTPEEAGSSGASAILAIGTILSGGTAAPLTVPAMGSLAFDSVMGDYSEHLAESKEDFDPAVASVLLALVALESYGSKAVLVDLPTLLAKKSSQKFLREGIKAKTKEARSEAFKGMFKTAAAEVGGLAIEGTEEMVEEGLEGLVTILYEEEFEDLRSKILEGQFSEKEFSEVYDVATRGGWKPFVLGSAIGGAARVTAGAKERFSPESRAARALESQVIAQEVAQQAAQNRAEAEGGPEVLVDEAVATDESDSIEDVAPEEAVTEESPKPTAADIDNDVWADAMVAASPDAVDGLLLTDKAKRVRSRPRGRDDAAWRGIIPDGMVTNRSERQAIWDRLKAARERAAEGVESPEVVIDPETREAERAEWGPADEATEVPVEEDSDIEDLDRRAEMYREQSYLESVMDESDPDSEEYASAAARLAELENEASNLGIEMSRVMPATVDAAALIEEPGTQQGSAEGGFATDRRTGKRVYQKRYENKEQSRNEVIANRLYQEAGVNVPDTRPMTEGGEVVGVASEVIEGVKPGIARDAADGLVIDAWLGNWDVVGRVGDNMQVGPNGEAVRIDQGGTLTTRARGAPKGDAFGDTVSEVETIVENNPDLAPTSEQLSRGLDALESISEADIKRIVLENGGDNALVRKLIKRRRDLLSRRSELVNQQEIDASNAEASQRLEMTNERLGSDYTVMSDDQVKSLPKGQRDLAERARRRLGRNVVWVYSPSGTANATGFVFRSQDPDTIYLVGDPNINQAISEVSARTGLKERRVREAYEMVMLQTLIHENVHLTEDQNEGLKDGADTMLRYLLAKRAGNERISILTRMLAKGEISSQEYETELRAESLTDFEALSQSGIETLFIDRGFVRNVIGRVRRMANRLGGSKDVKIVNQMIATMERGASPLPSSPDIASVEPAETVRPHPLADLPVEFSEPVTGNAKVPSIKFRAGSAAELQRAHRKSKRAAFLSPIDIKDMNAKVASGDAIIRVSEDANTGYVLVRNEDPAAGWDIQGVFNVGGKKGAGIAAVADAVANGGRTLDCFDGFLPVYYNAFGFTETQRMDFNDEFAPEWWDFDRDGRPQVVLMTFTGDSTNAQEIAEHYVYKAYDPNWRDGPRAGVTEDWPSLASRIEGKAVPAVRTRGGGQDPAVLTRSARYADVEFSRQFPLAPEWWTAGMAIPTAKDNPTPENLAVLLSMQDAIKGHDKPPQVKRVIRLLGGSGIVVDEAKAKLVSEIYPGIRKYHKAEKKGRMTELRGDKEQFGPAGTVERAMSSLFEANDSPTAQQLSAMPGAPKARPKDTENPITVVPMRVSDKQPWSEARASSFVTKAKESAEAVDAKVSTTNSADNIEKLLKDNDVVIYTGEGGPAVHAKKSFLNRHAAPVDYSEMLRVTREAFSRGLHNWYREFGQTFRDLGGDALVNEAAMVFGVTSSQSAVENNFSDTLHIMRLVREHKAAGKPWTHTALKETLWPYLLDESGNRITNKDGEFVRGSDVRRSKHPADGTARMFVSQKQMDTIIDFYISGAPEGGAIKTRTYSGSVAEAAWNNFYPFSVQDRHQAATYGFFRGKFDPVQGGYTIDKIFMDDKEYRYAAYVTNRLSMEEGIHPATPSQVQAAQWFYTKAGEGPYPDVEAKSDKGLVQNFAANNPDLTTGTVESAVRFAEFELADFAQSMEGQPDSVAFPAPDLQVPVYENAPYLSLDYAAGQAVAREFAIEHMARAPRLTVLTDVQMTMPGLSMPALPLSETVASDMLRNMVSAVTESDGTVRLLNDMGIPHTALRVTHGRVGNVSYPQFSIVPMLGSINSPVTAKIVGSVIGFGLMQDRVAVTRHRPDGNGATIRLTRTDGMPLTAAEVSSVSMPSVPNAEVVQVASSRDAPHIDVMFVPDKGSISNKQTETAFKDISRKLADEGIKVEATVLRTEVETLGQQDYRSQLEGSGFDVSAQGQSGILGRVLSEITAPVLPVLQGAGYKWNRNEFQQETGLTQDQVGELPIEFSRQIPITPLDEAASLADKSNAIANFTDEDTQAANREYHTSVEVATAEAEWWGTLSAEERVAVHVWTSATTHNHFKTLPSRFVETMMARSPFAESSGSSRADRWNREMLSRSVGAGDGQRMERVVQGGHIRMRAVATEDYGSWDWFIRPSLHWIANGSSVPGRYGQTSLTPAEMEPVADGFTRGIRRGLEALTAKYGTPDIAELREVYGVEPTVQFVSETNADGERVIRIDAPGISPNLRNMDGKFIGGIATAMVFKATDNGPLDFSKGTPEQQADQFEDMVQIMTENIMSGLREVTSVPNVFMDYAEATYNNLLTAMSKAPSLEGEVWRGTNLFSPSEFYARFPVGTRFRSAAPSSASLRARVATGFDDTGVFRINTASGRSIGNDAYHELIRRSYESDDYKNYKAIAAPQDVVDAVLAEDVPVPQPNMNVVSLRTAGYRTSPGQMAGRTEPRMVGGESVSEAGLPQLTSVKGRATRKSDWEEASRQAIKLDRMMKSVRSKSGRHVLDGDPTHVAAFLAAVGKPEAAAIAETAGTDYQEVLDRTGEGEVTLMPGIVYEVMPQSEDGLAINVREVSVSAEEAAQTPVLPEFSRRMPVGPTPDPALSVPSSKQLKWKSKRFRTALQDRFIELDYLQRDIAEAYEGIEMESDALNRLRNMPGRVAIKSELFHKRVIGTLITGVTKAGVSLAEFGEYAAARHALDVNAMMRTTGMSGTAARPIDSGLSDAEANKIIAKMQSHPNFREIEAYRKRLVSIGKKNLRLMLRTGLIGQDEYNDMITEYPNYVPFWDAFDDQTDKANEAGEQFIVPPHILKQRTGRDTDSLKGNEKFFADRIAAMADQRFRIIRKSEQNVALQRLLGLADKVDDDGLFEIYDSPPMKTVRRNGKDRRVPDMDAIRGDKTLLRVKVAGEDVFLRIKNPRLAEAIRQSNKSMNSVARTLLGVASSYTSMKRFFSTQFGNPDFSVRNPVRDFQTAGATIAGDPRHLARMEGGKIRKLSVVERLRIMMGATAGIAPSWALLGLGLGTSKAKRQLAQYRLLGGRQQFFDIQDPEVSRRAIRRAISKATPVAMATKRQLAGKAIRAVTLPVRGLVDIWQHVNTTLDDGIRFTTFRSLVAKGIDPEKAIEITRDLTVDFSRVGTAGRGINAMYAFANASVQGSTKTLRLLKSPSGAAVFGAYFSMGVVSELWNDDDEDKDGNGVPDWEEIQDWEKDGNAMFKVQDEEGNTVYAKVPIAYGLAIPYVAGRRLVRWLKGKESMSEAAVATLTATYSNLNPFGGDVISPEDPRTLGSGIGRTLAPDLIDPFISLSTNRDWLGNRIYNEPFPTDPSPVRSEMGREPKWVGDEWAADMVQFANRMTGGDDIRAGLIDYQPEWITYMLGDAFSGAWRTIDRVGEQLQARWIRENFPDEAEEWRLKDIPGVRPFFTNTPNPMHDTREFYRYRDIARAADADIKEADEMGRFERADELFAGAEAELAGSPGFKEVKDYRKEMKESITAMKADGATKKEIEAEKLYWMGIIREAQRDTAMTVREVQREIDQGG